MSSVEIPASAAPAECAPVSTSLIALGQWASREFAAALKPLGLKRRHLETLLKLRMAPLTQQALGDAIEIDAAQLVGLLNDLEADGLVLRRRDPGDRRRHIVEIADLGLSRLADAHQAMQDTDARVMSALAPGDRNHLRSLLETILSHDLPTSAPPEIGPCPDDD